MRTTAQPRWLERWEENGRRISALRDLGVPYEDAVAFARSDPVTYFLKLSEAQVARDAGEAESNAEGPHDEPLSKASDAPSSAASRNGPDPAEIPDRPAPTPTAAAKPNGGADSATERPAPTPPAPENVVPAESAGEQLTPQADNEHSPQKDRAPGPRTEPVAKPAIKPATGARRTYVEKRITALTRRIDVLEEQGIDSATVGYLVSQRGKLERELRGELPL